MRETSNDGSLSRWDEAARIASSRGNLAADKPGAPTDDAPTVDVERVIELVNTVRDYSVRPANRSEPYFPLWKEASGSWLTPGNLSDEDLEILRAAVSYATGRLLRARILDVIALRTSGRERVKTWAEMLDEVIAWIPTGDLKPLNFQMIDRALDLSARLGKSTLAQSQNIEDQLLARFFKSDREFEPLHIINRLRDQGRAKAQSKQIAFRLRALAKSRRDAAHIFLEEAAEWHLLAGESNAAYDDLVAVTLILQERSNSLVADQKPDSIARACHDLELALKTLSKIPRSARTARDADGLHDKLTADIRRAGRATLGLLRPVATKLPRIGEAREQFLAAIEQASSESIIGIFLNCLPITPFEKLKTSTEQLTKDYPLTHSFSHVAYAKDGRTMARSSAMQGDVTYGVRTSVWRTMVRNFQIRVALIVQDLLFPTWQTLQAVEALTLSDFAQLTRWSTIVPSGREIQVAQALLYGYGGDFLTAAQLLAPQLENMVRVHLGNAGERTSSIADGIETENGLSTLMASQMADNVFGPDIAFEIRALFCSADGPNLRNEFAHGLADDSHRDSVNAIYAWWFMWRLVQAPFHNAERDAQASADRERVDLSTENRDGPVDQNADQRERA